MRRLCLISIAAVLAGCSPPDGGVRDLGVDAGGAETEVAITSEADFPDELLQGELLVSLESTSQTLLFESDDYVFVFRDDNELAWFAKDNTMLVTYARWPDSNVDGGGPPGRDLVVTSDRAWFQAETGQGDQGLAGAEHSLGAPFPLFGQPIVIIDVGPLMSPRGIAFRDNQFLAGWDDKLVVANETVGVTETVNLPGPLVFDHIDDGEQGAAFWTSSDGGFALHTFTVADGVSQVTSEHEQPRGWVTASEGHAWISASGALHVDDLQVANASTDETAAMGRAGDTVAWSSGGTVRFTTDGGQSFAAIDGAADRVHSIIVDSSSIYWSTHQGIHRYSLR